MYFFSSTVDDMLMVPFKYLWCLLETGVVYYHQGARRVKKGSLLQRKFIFKEGS